MRRRSRGEDFELLGQGRIRIEGILRLSLANHVNHFDAGKDGGGGRGLNPSIGRTRRLMRDGSARFDSSNWLRRMRIGFSRRRARSCKRQARC